MDSTTDRTTPHLCRLTTPARSGQGSGTSWASPRTRFRVPRQQKQPPQAARWFRTWVQNLTSMFSNPVLQATAATAAENIWRIVPRGTLGRAGSPTPAAAVAAAAAAGAKPLPPLLLKAAEYAAASIYTHMLEDGDIPLPPRPAMAVGGTIDAYLCECSRLEGHRAGREG